MNGFTYFLFTIATWNVVQTQQPTSTIFNDIVENTNTFCDTGPTAMTNALFNLTGGVEIPQYCIPNPVPSLDDSGFKRCYYLFVPPCTSGPTPLVMDMHGSQSCPLFNAYYNRWIETAINNCFAVFFPVGVIDPKVADWPCFSFEGGSTVGIFQTKDCCCYKNGRSVNPSKTRDLVVIDRMIYDIYENERISEIQKESHNATTTALISSSTTLFNASKTKELASLDASRIYLAGHSNGCIGALAVGSHLSSMVAAVCCHAGGNIMPIPRYYQPIPVMLVNGMKDDRIWYQHAQRTYNAFARVNQCQNETSRQIRSNGTIDAVKYTYYNCSNDANVSLLLLNESGHIPYFYGFEITEDAETTTMDTTEMAWQFCSQYWNNESSLLSATSAAKTYWKQNRMLWWAVIATIFFLWSSVI